MVDYSATRSVDYSALSTAAMLVLMMALLEVEKLVCWKVVPWDECLVQL